MNKGTILRPNSFLRHLAVAIPYAVVALALLAPMAGTENWVYEPGNELMSHLRQIEQAKRALDEGQFPARVSPYEHNGWQYAIFQYDCPLFYNIAGLLQKYLFPTNPYVPAKIMLWLSLFLGGFGAYLLAYYFVHLRRGAILAGFAYMSAPYILLNATAWTHLPQSLALGVSPLVVYLTLRAVYGGRWKYLLGAAIGWNMLLLSHTVGFLYNALFLSAMVGFLGQWRARRKYFRRIRRYAVMFAIALVLAAWYIAPIAALSGLLAIDLPKYTYNPVQWFHGMTPISALLSPIHVALPIDGLPLGYGVRIGWPLLAGMLLAIYGLLVRPRTMRAPRVVALVCLLFGVALFLVWSPVDVWQYFPEVLWKVGFTSRIVMQCLWLGIIGLIFAIHYLLRKDLTPPQLVAGAILIVLTSATNMPIDRGQAKVVSVDTITRQPDILNDHRENFLVQRQFMARSELFSHCDSSAFTDYFGWLVLDDERELAVGSYGPPSAARVVGYLPPQVFSNTTVTLYASVNRHTVVSTNMEPGRIYDIRVPIAGYVGLSDKKFKMKFWTNRSFPLKPNEVHDNTIGKERVAVHLRYFTFEGLPPSQRVVTVDQIQPNSFRRRAAVVCDLQATPEAQAFQLPALYYPGLLRITADGAPLEYFPTFIRPWFLLATVRLPPGAHRVTVEFTGVRWANALSVLALLAFTALTAWLVVRRLQARRQPVCL